MNKKEVIIMRGCPGSGKSTFLANNYPTAYVCSAVNFFIDDKGSYNFNRSDLEKAHEKCFDDFVKALISGLPEVAVDNTNINVWEFDEYVEQASKYNYKVTVCNMIVIDVKDAASRNIHNVPYHKVVSMNAHIQYYPGERRVYSY